MSDHREIGRQMDLFMFHEYSPGSIFWLPNGTILYNLLSDKIREYNLKNGYVEVKTPQLFKKPLWETSGHWNHFKDNMFSFQDGEEIYSLKPMNCPSHMLIFKSKQWSYRDLPYRIHDQGILHRNEVSGALSGLTRVRCFCQDDGHLFVKPQDICEEIQKILKMNKRVYEVLFKPGTQVRTVISTRPDNFMGDSSVWDHAEDNIIQALKEAKIDYSIDKGAGAFYGPKIDFMIKDSAGKEYQTATVQLDYQLPQRFDLHYVDKDGKQQVPIVIHRAMYGSFERIIAILLEHWNGLPMWLSPIQAIFLPISEKHVEYCKKISDAWNESGCRTIVDDNNATLSSKILSVQEKRIPYHLVVGDREVAANTVMVRQRKEIIAANDFLADLMKQNMTKF